MLDLYRPPSYDLMIFESTVREVAQYVVGLPPSVYLVIGPITAAVEEVFPRARPPKVRLLGQE